MSAWTTHAVEPSPGTYVIFGASGDLTKRKLIPAIYALYERRLLPKQFAVIGVARTEMTREEFRQEVRESIANIYTDEARMERFLTHFYYVAGAYNKESTFKDLRAEEVVAEQEWKTEGNALYYMATPPSLFLTVVQGLYREGLLDEPDGRWARVIIEKPFGHDLESAIQLDKDLKKYTKESQLYRIDHYLGKETVQNILILRFANAIFEPLWNRKYIEHVELTVAESLGVGSRAGYYDGAGALRDMFQNHMMQMLALIAMEPPAKFTADDYRDEIVKLIRSLRPVTAESAGEMSVRGQYTTSEALRGYLEEENIPSTSKTETYVGLKTYIDNWRWQGVPFYLRTGKGLSKKKSEIAITFKKIPHSIFDDADAHEYEPNVLVLQMQPEEGMGLSIQVKTPGPNMQVNTLQMKFSYQDFITEAIPDAYERLLLDGFIGDQTLFVRNDAVEASWRFFMPLLDAWKADAPGTDIRYYEAGSEGPDTASLWKEEATWRPL